MNYKVKVYSCSWSWGYNPSEIMLRLWSHVMAFRNGFCTVFSVVDFWELSFWVRCILCVTFWKIYDSNKYSKSIIRSSPPTSVCMCTHACVYVIDKTELSILPIIFFWNRNIICYIKGYFACRWELLWENISINLTIYNIYLNSINF